MTRIEVPTYTAAIYIAGDAHAAREACRAHCMEVGLCVTVEPLDFIYTGGAESGVRIGLINYPRFPAEPADIWAKAVSLAELLIVHLHQHSASVVATDRTLWLSRREAA